MREQDKYREWARLLKALGNGARLMIVDRLDQGECSVGELAKLVGLDQSTVSKHLSMLRSHGIVSDRRAGNVVYYHLETPCVLGFLSCATRVLEERGQERPSNAPGAVASTGGGTSHE
jgi:ArsR family transcriptional regulator